MNKLNKIREILGVKVKLEQVKTSKGAILEAEVFEAGSSVFIVNEEDRIPVPVGEFELEDGRILSVAEEGVIASIGEAAEVEPEPEQEMEQETPVKKVIESVSKETQFEEVKAEVKEEEVEKVLFSDEQKEVIKSLFAEFMAEVKAEVTEETPVVELSEVEPIKHSPEKAVEVKVHKYGQNRRMSIEDRVIARLRSN